MLNFIRNIFSFLSLSISFLFGGLFLYSVLFAATQAVSKTWFVTRFMQRSFNRTFVRFLQNSGPTFIKLGQVLSTRPDIIGESLGFALSALQDKLPASNIKYVHKTIEEEFSTPHHKLFKSISEHAIAAGSMAQVHSAETLNGRKVAIKVLRPNIEKRFQRDVSLLFFIFKGLQLVSIKARKFRIVEVIKTLDRTSKFELDLRMEAASADAIREKCADDHDVMIPAILWSLTSKNIMTSQWIDGCSITNKKALKDAGHNLNSISRKLAVCFFNQAYRDGFFHADMHPGNILVTPDGKIALLDFGIIGTLSEVDRLSIAEIMYSFITRDYKRVAEIHFRIGWVPKHQNMEAFALACRSVGEPIVGLPANKISFAKLLKQLLDMAANFEMEPQPQLLLLQKTMMNIEGVGMQINPNVNMWKLAEPWMKDWASRNFGIKAQIKKAKSNFFEIIHSLPGELKNISRLLDKLANK